MMFNSEGSPSSRLKPARAAGVIRRWWLVLDTDRAANSKT